MPTGAQIIHCRDDTEGWLNVWAIVEPENPKRPVGIYVRGTGHPLPDARYVGTAFQGVYVWHVFQESN